MLVYFAGKTSAPPRAFAVQKLSSCCCLQPPRRKARTASKAKASSKATPQEARTKTIASFFQSASALGEGRTLTQHCEALAVKHALCQRKTKRPVIRPPAGRAASSEEPQTAAKAKQAKPKGAATPVPAMLRHALQLTPAAQLPDLPPARARLHLSEPTEGVTLPLHLHLHLFHTLKLCRP